MRDQEPWMTAQGCSAFVVGVLVLMMCALALGVAAGLFLWSVDWVRQ